MTTCSPVELKARIVALETAFAAFKELMIARHAAATVGG